MTTTTYTSGSHSGTVSSGDELDLLGTATGSGLIVNLGGTVVISGGGSTIGTSISGQESVSSGATDSGSTVFNGGREMVYAGGMILGTIVSGGNEYINSGGVASATTISSSGLQTIYSGGVALVTTVSSGGFQSIDSGGVASATTISSGGTQGINSGGVASATIISSGGLQGVNGIATDTTINSGSVQNVNSNGIASAAIILNGGTQSVYGAGSATDSTINSGGIQNLYGGTSSATTISGGGIQAVFSGSIASTTLVMSGGKETIVSGAVATGTTVEAGGTAIVNSGGLLTVSGAGGTGTIQLQSGSTLAIDGTTAPLEEITGFTGGSVIDLEAYAYGTITGFTETQNSVTFHTTGGGTETLHIDGIGAYAGQLSEAADGSTVFETCFATGTMIATPYGEQVVETITPGTLVTTAQGPRSVIWCGHRTVDVGRLAAPEDHWLVHIRAGAFSNGVPSRDLWVTQEHGILVDGGLIPARMLVNGRSILLDRNRPHYTYYHLELEQHGILLAEGLETESYLDTGNRASFANAPVTSIQPDLGIDAGHALWETAAAAPLTVGRDAVEPVWQRLVSRAEALGYHGHAPAARSDDPALQLLLEDGRTVNPCQVIAGLHSFQIPSGARAMRLLSRSARPSDSIGPFVDDRRQLGVAVTALVLRTEGDDVRIPAAGLGLSGWHAAESDVRWTDGAASLDLPATDGPSMLEVHVVGTQSYTLGKSSPGAVVAA